MSRQRYAWIAALLLLAETATFGQAPTMFGTQPGTRPPASTKRPAEPKPTITRQRAFAIPFSLSTSANPAPPAEVRLYVSDDLGANWRLFERQRPDAQAFRFSANRDGEYWFIVRSVDAAGRIAGAQEATPEVIVIIDTELPTLELSVATKNYGEVQAQWAASDPNLAPHTFRLQYQDDPAGPWHDVEVDVPGESETARDYRNSAEWWLRSRGQEVLIRAEILDHAGNQALATERLYLDRIAQQNGRNNDPNADLANNSLAGSHDAFGATSSSGRVAAHETASGGMADRNRDSSRPTHRADGADTINGVQDPWSPFGSSGEYVGDIFSDRPSANSREDSTFGGLGANLQSRAEANSEVRGVTNPRDLTEAVRQRWGSAWDDSRQDDRELRPQPSRVPPPIASQAGSNRNSPFSDTAFPNAAYPRSAYSGLPNSNEASATTSRTVASPVDANSRQSVSAWDDTNPTGQTRVIRTPQFQLDYDLFDVAPADVLRVELWYTTDKGRTWNLYPEADADSISPMNIDMRTEGLYGFRLAVHSRQVSAKPPQNGDPADMWVAIDGSAPRVRLLDANFGEGVHQNSVIIRWEAADPNLAEYPITLKFSEYAGGPWSAIATGLPNSGQYVWQLDARSPREIFFRLEAQDLANNVGFDELTQPIRTENHTPKGRILDLRPLQQTFRPLDSRR